MSDSDEPSSSGDSGLQFDRADYGRGQYGHGQGAVTGITCAFCGEPVARYYFDINGASACEVCEPKVRRGSEGAPLRATRAFFAALILGGAGAAIYNGVANLGYWVGIVSLVVGWLVGKGVQWGSRRRGGLAYQLWAAVVTYVAVTCSDLISVPWEKLSADFLGYSWREIHDPFSGSWNTSQVIHLLIIALGVYEAWAMNRPAKVKITGPLQVGSSG